MALRMIIKHMKQIITLAKQVAPLAKVLAKRAWMKSIAWLKGNVEDAISWGKEILTSIYNGWFKGKGRKKLPKKEEVEQSSAKVEQDKAEREAAEERIESYLEVVAAMKTEAAMSESEEDEAAMSEAAMSEAAILEAAISEEASESEDVWRNYWCERFDPFTGI